MSADFLHPMASKRQRPCAGVQVISQLLRLTRYMGLSIDIVFFQTLQAGTIKGNGNFD